MPVLLNLIGKKFGRWTVSSRSKTRLHNQVYWRCVCSCGSVKDVNGGSLRSGVSMSCGCYNLEKIMLRNTKHGRYGCGSYTSWANMIQRCTNKKNPGYKNYGGRGIGVCKRWLTFQNFYQDMGDRPPKKEIDRINNNGDYGPTNCRWVNKKTQNRNRRNNKYLVCSGENKLIAEWADIFQIDKNKIIWRIKNGWTAEEAVTFKSGRFKN